MKLAPSPPLAKSAPSGPNCRSPIECEESCWHQSSISVFSEVAIPAVAVNRVRRPLTGQASTPGLPDIGQGSPS